MRRSLILMANYFHVVHALNLKSDSIGALASGLCLIHCLATPFLFVAQSCAKSCCSTAPGWWLFIDYLFIALSFMAIYFASKQTSKKWVSMMFYVLWFLLTALVINESQGFLLIAKEWINAPAFGLIALHLYNRRYCRCGDDLCVAN
jgi:hypothetical protein